MKKTLVLISAFALLFFSCKEEDAAPENKLSVSLEGSYEEQYLNNYDTIQVVFAAAGEDYTVTYQGETQVQYPNYDSSIVLCSDLTYHAFLLQTTSNTFTVKAGETLKLDLVFDPSNFSYQKENIGGLVLVEAKEEACSNCRTEIVVPSCTTVNSNGIGTFSGVLKFLVGSETKEIAVTATSKEADKVEVILEARF